MNKLSTIFLLAMLVIPSTSYSDGVICQNPGIAGYESAATRAKFFLPENTSRIENAKVYIEKDVNGAFYYHSNYLPKHSNYPTKIAGFPELRDAQLGIQNIVFPGYKPSEGEIETFFLKHKDIELILDESVFKKDGTSSFDFSEFNNIKLAKRNDKKLEETINYSQGWSQQELLVQAGKCCVYMKPRAPVEIVLKKLKQKKYSKNRTKFISLIKDTSTEKAIEKSSLPNKNLDYSSNIAKQLESEMSSMRGETLVILGHVENNSYVVRDSSGKEISQIPIHDLRLNAIKYNVQLIDVGCNTARQNSMGSSSVGVAARFNSLHAVELINSAHTTAKNYSDFIFGISSEKLPIVIESEVFENVDVATDVVAKQKWTENSFEPVGAVTITLGSSITLQSFDEEEHKEIQLVDPRHAISFEDRLRNILKQGDQNDGR